MLMVLSRLMAVATLAMLLDHLESCDCQHLGESNRISRSLPSSHSFRSRLEAGRPEGIHSLSDLLNGLTFADYSANVLRASIIHHLSPGWGSVHTYRQHAQTDDFNSLSSDFFAKLGNASGTTSCVWDDTLNNATTLLKNKRVFIAANFKDNEAVLPHLLVQIWHTIALLPEDSVYVSIYESASQDQTGFWLQKFRELFQALGVPHRINSDGAIAYVGHNIVQRIELLSRVRNAALEPLWDGTDLWQPTDSAIGETFDSEGEHARAELKRMANLPPTHILFTNDVYACARDNVRLIYHDVDMACGTDWYPMGDVLSFYDVWVTRGITGTKIQWFSPYLEDKQSSSRLAAGLHVPVQSCWNGLVVMKAAPLISSKLKFRTSRPGECFASECKLICDDLRELGFTNIIMDPGVRLTYSLNDALEAFNSKQVEKVEVTTWADINASPINVLDFEYKEQATCYPP